MRNDFGKTVVSPSLYWVICALAVLPDGIYVTLFLLLLIKTEEQARIASIADTVLLTQKEFDEIEEKDENTVYLVSSESKVSKWRKRYFRQYNRKPWLGKLSQ